MIRLLDTKPFPAKNGDKYRNSKGKIFYMRNGTWIPLEVKK